MELRDAIITAGRFIWKGKQNSPLKNMRFIPYPGGFTARLYAHNGPEGVLIDVEGAIPNIALDGEKLLSIAKDTKVIDPPKLVNSNGEGTWDVAGVQLKGESIEEYPALPVEMTQVQDWKSCPDWWAIEHLLHAVSKDKQRADLMCLRFTPNAVDATDRHRIARAFIVGEWDGLVSASLFKSWPKGDVEYLFGETLAAFRIGDEIRMCALHKGRFEECEKALPPHWDGARVVVETAGLLDSVKRVKGLSERVSLALGILTVDVAGGGYVNTLSVKKGDDLPVIDGDPSTPTTVEVDAKQMFEALKGLPTPTVQLGFIGPGDPFRIDAGPLSVGIWGFTGG